MSNGSKTTEVNMKVCGIQTINYEFKINKINIKLCGDKRN